jgi:hypothetical protein
MLAEQSLLRGKAKRAYEWGRLRRALGGSIPTLLVAGMVAALVREISWPLVIGLALYLASVLLLWFGRSPGRSVLPGVVYGLLPLTGGVIAKLHGHVCMGLSCYSTCMLYCVGGGVVAGVLVGRLAARSDTPTAVFASAAATALLTGAIGSSCVGVHGIVGMAAGILLGAVPHVVRRAARSKT